MIARHYFCFLELAKHLVVFFATCARLERYQWGDIQVLLSIPDR